MLQTQGIRNTITFTPKQQFATHVFTVSSSISFKQRKQEKSDMYLNKEIANQTTIDNTYSFFYNILSGLRRTRYLHRFCNYNESFQSADMTLNSLQRNCIRLWCLKHTLCKTLMRRALLREINNTEQK